MGAASCDLPSIVISGGPMLNGRFQGRQIGSGTDVWKFSEDVRAGIMSEQDFANAESAMSRSPGHCMTMGTASTMASMVEALGLALPGNAAYPAVDARRNRIARMTGRRIVEMVNDDLRPSATLTKQAFGNAIRVNGAIGGSTNAVVHLLAIAGRVGTELSLDDWDALGRDVPTILDLMPSGRFLMEDFCYAGGIPAVMKEIADMLDLDALTVTGKSVRDNIADARNDNPEVIRPRDRALTPHGGIAVLRGNLAPDGAIIKPSAASPSLMKHRGRAVVFEVGNMALPQKLLKKGVRDMIRISDARMSGTAFGTVVLHAAPEAAVGGPLALVRSGDMIELDVEARKLHLDVSEQELARRRQSWQPPEPAMHGGYQGLYVDHVLQADRGADLDFLVGNRGHAIPRESH